MKKEILKVIKYFLFFNYHPTFKEIYTFLPKKTSKKSLKIVLLSLELKKKIKKIKNRYFLIKEDKKYTLGEYSIKMENTKFKSQNYSKFKNQNYNFYNFRSKFDISQKKLQNWRFRLYIKLLSFFPQIKLVGLSGSIAMMNAKEDDDIDLFIITAKNRLFTGRFIAIILAELLGLRRKRNFQVDFVNNFKSLMPCFSLKRNTLQKITGSLKSSKQVSSLFQRGSAFVTPDKFNKDKVCLNLFFDEGNLMVPDFKKNKYVAHEVLQMKPIVNKNQTYEKFLQTNRWVFRLFPNAKENSKLKTQNSKPQLKTQNYIKNFKFLTAIFNFGFLIFNYIELILKKMQMSIINRRRTNEITTDTQLWLQKEDFFKKLNIKS
ncbi:MAG: nucleotidyltransferase domain-containing protein [Patescibacteria group bacterium]|nr:nucleotidyltransferase domain-containing protein [Patescibacteria group bacterium]